jgi:CheY-like chemotaxis protein
VTARVLVVDDDSLIPDMVCRALRRRGHEAVAVNSAADALARLAAERWTHLLTDLRMPGGGGLELAERALALHPALHVVVMSGSSRGEAQVPSRFPLLLKPFEMADVLTLLSLEGRPAPR